MNSWNTYASMANNTQHHSWKKIRQHRLRLSSDTCQLPHSYSASSSLHPVYSFSITMTGVHTFHGWPGLDAGYKQPVRVMKAIEHKASDNMSPIIFLVASISFSMACIPDVISKPLRDMGWNGASVDFTAYDFPIFCLNIPGFSCSYIYGQSSTADVDTTIYLLDYYRMLKTGANRTNITRT